MIASTHAAWRGSPLAVGAVRKLFAVDAQPKPARRRIYISRKDAKMRHVANEDALLFMLAGFGFEEIQLSGMTASAQAALFSEAECCVAPHGAGMTNIIFMPKGSLIVEFFHNRAGTSGYVPVAKTLDHKYAYLVCGSAESDSPEDHEEFVSRLPRFHEAPLWVDINLLRAWMTKNLVDR